MLECYTLDSKQATIPIKPVVESQFQTWLQSQNEKTRQWVKSTGFSAKPDSIFLIPNAAHELDAVLIGVKSMTHFLHYGLLPKMLPDGHYHLEQADFEEQDHYERALLGWGLGSYQFTAYRRQPAFKAKLLVPPSSNYNLLESWITTIYLIRDLINTPAEDMGPPELAQAVINVGKEFDANVNVISGEDLLEAGFPTVYAVGRAGSRPSCFIDLQWGEVDAPKVTLVGKGVCFDTGGLDVKTSGGMLLMKKDMGGAAHVLGLARMIMSEQLPVRLRLLIPAVENAIDNKSYRPGDVLQTRAGLTVEVTNTDAEGRLVLCDALAEAATGDPDVIIDFATLTGAARVALGPDIPALYSNNDDLAAGLLNSAKMVQDPLWQMPLYQPYRNYLKSDIADMVNSAAFRLAGSIMAALFLQNFVSDQISWAHIDLFAWKLEEQPGRPRGGEVMGLRAVFHYLQKRFGTR